MYYTELSDHSLHVYSYTTISIKTIIPAATKGFQVPEKTMTNYTKTVMLISLPVKDPKQLSSLIFYKRKGESANADFPLSY